MLHSPPSICRPSNFHHILLIMLHLLSTGKWITTVSEHLHHSRRLNVMMTTMAMAKSRRGAKVRSIHIPVVLPVSYTYTSRPCPFITGPETIVPYTWVCGNYCISHGVDCFIRSIPQAPTFPFRPRWRVISTSASNPPDESVRLVKDIENDRLAEFAW